MRWAFIANQNASYLAVIFVNIIRNWLSKPILLCRSFCSWLQNNSPGWLEYRAKVLLDCGSLASPALQPTNFAPSFTTWARCDQGSLQLNVPYREQQILFTWWRAKVLSALIYGKSYTSSGESRAVAGRTWGCRLRAASCYSLKAWAFGYCKLFAAIIFLSKKRSSTALVYLCKRNLCYQPEMMRCLWRKRCCCAFKK